MDVVLARIDEWLRSGLIDAATAARLKAAEVGRAEAGELALSNDYAALSGSPAALAEPQTAPRSAALSDVFGPGPTIAEMFAYLGAGFLLAAWTSFVTRQIGDGSGMAQVSGGLMVAAAVLTGLGLMLRRGDARRRRGAGMAFLAATVYAAGAAAGFVSGLHLGGPSESLIVAAVAVGIAAVFRLLHPALLTQLGLLISVTAFGGLFLAWLRSLVAPINVDDKGQPVGAMPDPILLVVVTASVWLLVALGLGLLALAERSSSEDDPEHSASARRATLSRAWAGIVAVVGLASALTQADLLPSGDYGRVIAPWLAELLLLVLAGVLVERAFRRDSIAFLFAAGLALIIALTDFNFSYLSSSTEIGLLIEGAILLAVGVVADRLRRRLPGGRPAATRDEDGAGPPAIADSAS